MIVVVNRLMFSELIVQFISKILIIEDFILLSPDLGSEQDNSCSSIVKINSAFNKSFV